MKDIIEIDEIIRGTGIPEHATIHDLEFHPNGLEIEWTVEE